MTSLTWTVKKMCVGIKIYTLGRFEIVKADGPVRFTGKTPRKPLALLKAIIAFGGRNVREDRLIDALWPHIDGNASRFSLTSAIYRLRCLLGQENSLIRKDGKLSLNPESCWVDIWEVERLLDRLEMIPVNRDCEKLFLNENLKLFRQAAELYRGPFLDGENDAPWASDLADRVRRRLLNQLAAMGARSQAADKWDEAVIWYEKGMSVDPCAENVCRSLMSTYHKLGRTAEILSTYRRCRDSLHALAGIVPSTRTEELLKDLLTER